MVAQFAGITAGLSVAGAVFVNQAQDALRSLLPALSSTEISAIISGEYNPPPQMRKLGLLSRISR